MMVTDTLLVLDNLYNRATVIANVEVAPDADDAELRRLFAAAEARIEDWVARLAAPGTDPAAGHRAAAPRCRRRSRRTPTTGFRTTCAGSRSTSPPATPSRPCCRAGWRWPAPDPFLTYRYLRALNPAPYLYYLHCDDIHVIGSSPEILVRVEDGEVTLRPIAGTRPRGATPEQDAALAEELAADPKERAEHLMLVDLGGTTWGGSRSSARCGSPPS